MSKPTPYTWRRPDFPGDGSDVSWKDPTLLVICQKADVDTAIQPLLRSLKQPFAPGLVVSVFVHETMREGFCGRVRGSMEHMHRQAAGHAHYRQAVEMVDCLRAEVVGMLTPDDIRFRYTMAHDSPMIVCEFDHSFFGVSRPCAMVTLHTFRHASELPRLLARERVPFVSGAIWGAKMATVYEAALYLDLAVVYINCQGIPLTPVQEFLQAKQPHVVLARYHHFEVILHAGQHRVIVYPAKVIWEPPVREPAGAQDHPASQGTKDITHGVAKSKKRGHTKIRLTSFSKD
ncbi:uncharacterized protein LOC128261106 [Drosophila gunungcola]|uniref:Uncharacterized protein n=1 Tax=Drosophila gunungcola TaxID=103775 RepID=A0A9P9YE10_9MUSC|nr:uncharacterized protein LOC128261106 [Drosophila gunungcola]KAI8035010.1 hypothetical protein M5D96_012233 [Drosophila gunungcola]